MFASEYPNKIRHFNTQFNMRKHHALYFLVLATLVLLASCDSLNRQKEIITIVAGKITDPTGIKAGVIFSDKWGNEVINQFEPLGDDGSFIIKFNLDKPSIGRFSDNNETTKIYLEPGDSLYLTLDTKQFDETLRYSGTRANENNFLAARYLLFDDNTVMDSIINIKTESLDPDAYVKFADSLYEVKMNNLDTYSKEFPVSPDFAAHHKSMCILDQALRYPDYIYAHLPNNERDYNNIGLTQNFLNRYHGFINMDENVLKPETDGYTYFLMFYLNGLRGFNKALYDSVDNKDSLTFALIADNYKGFSREYITAYQFKGRLERYDTTFYRKNRAILEQILDNTEVIAQIDSQYMATTEALNRPMPEKAFLTNLNRKPYSGFTFDDLLKNYKGKVVYLDFWASWCGPCRGEMPFSLELQEAMKDKDVAFVYISSDQDSLAWEKYIKILEITGDHYLVNPGIREDVYRNRFSIRYIPRYMLFDKEGMVVDTNAARPSEVKTIAAKIEELL